LLADINNGDKHRTIFPLWTLPEAFQFDITNVTDCVLAERIWGRRNEPLRDGEEVALLPARRTGPNPDIEIRVSLVATPTVGSLVSLREWHVKTGILVFQILREFSAQRPSIHEIGAQWASLVAPARVSTTLATS
jgi:hypothetical protein